MSTISESNSNVESKQSEETKVNVPEDSNLIGEPPAKKARKPFVFTEKRKEAFERCRQRREERAKEKRESGYYQYQIKEYMKAYKRELEENRKAMSDICLPPLPLPHPHRQQQLQTDCVPTVATELTIPTTQPNQPPPTIVSQMSQKPMEVVEEKIVLMQPPPQTETQSVSAQETIHPSQLSSNQLKTNMNELNIQNQQVETRKRKVDFAETDTYIGVGAGNHMPLQSSTYVDDEDEDDENDMQVYTKPNRSMDMDDEDLIALLEEAKQRVQRRSVNTTMLQQRRTIGKQQRPSQASLFLDTVSGSGVTHPSQLFSNHNLHQSAKPKSSSAFVWL